MTDIWKTQNAWYIITKEYNIERTAQIFDQEQRDTINRLISHGFVPVRTVCGRGHCTRQHWNLEKFRTKRLGKGFKMITATKASHNFNSITYFIHYEQLHL